MKKHLVFIHPEYPIQFGPVIDFLLKNYDVKISFFSERLKKPVQHGVNHYFYHLAKTGHEDSQYFFSRYFETECTRMHGVYNAFLKSGIHDPDVLIGHSVFGSLGLFYSGFKDVQKINYFELFHDAFEKAAVRPQFPPPKPNFIRIPLRNATQLVDLEYCDKGYSPTNFQKSTYPKAYQHKISVLFDGIDTKLYKPGTPSVQSELPVVWPSNAKIITYVSRGLEALRGFDIFMEAAHKVSLKNLDVHFVVCGNPKTYYGNEGLNIRDNTFKEHVLKKYPYDLSRFHFMNWISEPALADLFRISQCHFYWTAPLTVSWSLFQSLSSGCLLLGSNTEPVRDVITDGVNGLIFDPYNTEQIAEMMLEVLSAPQEFQHIRDIARQEAVEKHSFEACLPKLAKFYMEKTSESGSTQTNALISV